MKTYTLNNCGGVRIPVIGLGGGIIRLNDQQQENYGLKARQQYKIYEYACKQYPGLLYDTSSSYGLNEAILGTAIKDFSLRSQMFLAVKISNREQRSGNIKEAFQNHLKTLNTDYVDLLMLHWPHPGTYLESYQALEEIYHSGGAKCIGVSNFHQHHLEALLERASVVPAVNQIEVHPLFTQEPLVHYCKSIGIQVMAYTPLGRMHDVLIKNKTLRLLAKKYQKTVPQIILRWDLERELIPIPRTLNPAHLDEFMGIFDFSLTGDEIKAINAVNENVRLRFNPDTVDYMIV